MTPRGGSLHCQLANIVDRRCGAAKRRQGPQAVTTRNSSHRPPRASFEIQTADCLQWQFLGRFLASSQQVSFYD